MTASSTNRKMLVREDCHLLWLSRRQTPAMITKKMKETADVNLDAKEDNDDVGNEDSRGRTSRAMMETI